MLLVIAVGLTLWALGAFFYYVPTKLRRRRAQLARLRRLERQLRLDRRRDLTSDIDDQLRRHHHQGGPDGQ